MRVHRASATVLVAVSVCCAKPHPSAGSAGTTATGAAQRVASKPNQTLTSTDSARLRYWGYVTQFGDSRQQFGARLGTATSASGDTVRNEHDSTVLDSVVTVVYRGITVRFFVGAGGKEFPTQLEVTDSTVRLPGPVGVGSRRSEVDQYFGEAEHQEQRADTLLLDYVVPATAPDYTPQDIWCALVSGVVRKVAWVYYTD